MEVLQELDAVTQAGEDSELSFKRIFPEKISVSARALVCCLKLPEVKIKGCHIIGLSGLPVGVGHGDLENRIQGGGAGGQTE